MPHIQNYVKMNFKKTTSLITYKYLNQERMSIDKIFTYFIVLLSVSVIQHSHLISYFCSCHLIENVLTFIYFLVFFFFFIISPAQLLDFWLFCVC